MKTEELLILTSEEYKKIGMGDYFKSNYNGLVSLAFNVIYPSKAAEYVLDKSGFNIDKGVLNLNEDIKELSSVDYMKLIADYYTSLWKRKGDKDFGLIRDFCRPLLPKDLETVNVTTHAVFIEALNDADLFSKLHDKVGSDKAAELLGKTEALGIKMSAKITCNYKDEKEGFYQGLFFLYNFAIHAINNCLSI